LQQDARGEAEASEGTETRRWRMNGDRHGDSEALARLEATG
jgi:hypothetical protein